MRYGDKNMRKDLYAVLKALYADLNEPGGGGDYDEEIAELQAGLAAETPSRASADLSLESQIGDLEAAQAATDGRVDAHASTLTDHQLQLVQDSDDIRALQNGLSAETSAREEADKALRNRIFAIEHYILTAHIHGNN